MCGKKFHSQSKWGRHSVVGTGASGAGNANTPKSIFPIIRTAIVVELGHFSLTLSGSLVDCDATPVTDVRTT